jgi:hypothetical protein
MAAYNPNPFGAFAEGLAGGVKSLGEVPMNTLKMGLLQKELIAADYQAKQMQRMDAANTEITSLVNQMQNDPKYLPEVEQLDMDTGQTIKTKNPSQLNISVDIDRQIPSILRKNGLIKEAQEYESKNFEKALKFSELGSQLGKSPLIKIDPSLRNMALTYHAQGLKLLAPHLGIDPATVDGYLDKAKSMPVDDEPTQKFIKTLGLIQGEVAKGRLERENAKTAVMNAMAQYAPYLEKEHLGLGSDFIKSLDAPKAKISVKPFGHGQVIDEISGQVVQVPVKSSNDFEDALKRESAKTLIKKMPSMRDDAVTANSGLDRIKEMEALLDKGAGGKYGKFLAAIGPYAEAIGFKSKNMTDAQAYEVLAKTLGGSMRMAIVGPGQVSNYENQLLQKVSGGGDVGRDAARELLNYYKKVAQDKVDLYHNSIDDLSEVSPGSVKVWRRLDGKPPKGAEPGGSGSYADIVSKHFGADAPIAMEILKAENGKLNPKATPKNANGTTDWGLFQVNDVNVPRLIKAGIITKAEDLLDPDLNIQAAKWLKDNDGWSPWNSSKGRWGAKVDDLIQRGAPGKPEPIPNHKPVAYKPVKVGQFTVRRK